MKLGPKVLIVLSGLMWLAVGIFLLSFGSTLILQGCTQESQSSLIKYLSRTIKDSGQIAVILLSSSIFLGYLKGRFVLSKAAQRQTNRLLNLPKPTRLKQLYTPRYYLLLALMIGLGMTMRYLPIGKEIRGMIDVAVGMALVSGAILYFRLALSPSLPPSNS